MTLYYLGRQISIDQENPGTDYTPPELLVVKAIDRNDGTSRINHTGLRVPDPGSLDKPLIGLTYGFIADRALKFDIPIDRFYYRSVDEEIIHSVEASVLIAGVEEERHSIQIQTKHEWVYSWAKSYVQNDPRINRTSPIELEVNGRVNQVLKDFGFNEKILALPWTERVNGDASVGETVIKNGRVT